MAVVKAHLGAAMIQIGSLSVDFDQRDIRRDGQSLCVGARALDILEVLHRASGSIVSKDDIMDAVWPGSIVGENRIQVHIATLRKALGVHRDLIKTVSGRGYVLIGDMHAGGQLSEPADASTAVGGQRSQVPPLIGRETEIGGVVDMLDRTPVVTLVGAGGIGKTTLALRIAHDLMHQTGEQAHVVELAQATTRDDVLGTLADALALQTDDMPSIDEIARAVTGTRCLLVLDNAEHVIDLIFTHANARYRLSESTRAYALEKLHNEGEFEYVVARHMRYEQEQTNARTTTAAVE
nr:winged helix-turn-helix domain-containing protein [Burkholderia sp. Bp9031]